ncbi:hypothetical protein Tco_1105948 [Tanacetum coccineum]
MTEFPQLDSGLTVPVFTQGDDPITYLNKAMDFLLVVAASRFPSTNNQLRTSFNLRNQATIQDGRVTMQQVQGRQGQSYTGTGYKGNATSSGGNNTRGQARVVKCYNFHGEGHVARQYPGIPDGQAAQTTILNTANFRTKDLDAYDSDCDDFSNAKAVLMANLSNYGLDVISEVPHFESYHNDMDNQSVHAMQGFEQILVVDFTDNEITSDSNIILYSQYLQETQQEAVQDTNLCAQQDSIILSVIEKMSEQMINHVNNWEKANHEKNNESLTAELERYKERVKTFEQRLNIDLSTREKMIDSQMDDMIKEKLALKQQIDSLKQNLSNQIKAKESLLQTFTVLKNESKEKESKYMDKEINLEKKIKELDNIVYKVGQSAQTFHINLNGLSKTLYDGSVISSQHAVIPVIDDEETLILEETLEDIFNVFDKDLLNEVTEVQTVFNQMEAAVQQCSLSYKLKTLPIFKLKEHIKSIRENNKEEKVKQEMDEIETINVELEHSMAKLLSKNELLHKEVEHLKKIYKDQFDSIKKTRALSKEHCDSLIAQLNSKSMENADLKGQIQEKVFVTTALQNELRRLKGKNMLDNATTITNATTIAPGMVKLDLDPLAPSLLKNKDAHIDYLKYTQEQIDILRGIVAQAKAKRPLDIALDFACKHAKRIQELLVYVQDTCPYANKPSEKLVAVTPMNKVKKVSSTSDSRPQPTGNKKNDRILQTPSSTMQNKVEVQLRKSNLSSNKKNRVKDPICDANVKHTMLNANSELICVKCKQCIFDANHDVCFLDFVNGVNVCSKSKSAKQSQQYNIWKPTGKVFTEVGYKWKPTGKLFTLVSNSCPLTRFTLANLVPPKETTSHSVETQKPEIKVYSRRPKQVKSVGSSKKAKIVKSKIANNSKPNHSWGSNATDVPSSSFLVNDRFRNDQIAKIIGYGDYQLGNITISRANYTSFPLGEVYHLLRRSIPFAWEKYTSFPMEKLYHLLGRSIPVFHWEKYTSFSLGELYHLLERSIPVFHSEKYIIFLGEVYQISIGRSIPFAWEKYTICLGEVYQFSIGRSIPFTWEKYLSFSIKRSIQFAWEKYTSFPFGEVYHLLG